MNHIPDVTTNLSEWRRLRVKDPLWQHKIWQDVYSKDGGVTFTISTEREHAEVPRIVRNSRKV